ncbi:MAG: STAS domain-containing protein [Aggregatilineales bacterium]
MFEVNVSYTHEVAIVEARGRIDSSTAAALGEALTSAVEAGSARVVLDLSQVDYMSSAGLREIVTAFKKARSLQGDIRVAEPTPRVLEVLELSGLDTFMKIYPSRAEAVNGF